jgi:hypothetical protein
VKATKRLKILPVLLGEEAFSDVVRESQELLGGRPHMSFTASTQTMRVVLII